MAYFDANYPDMGRMSDIDELASALRSSNGHDIVEYINRKRGRPRVRALNLFDGADNPINIRLDHLQPVQAPQPSNSDGDVIISPTRPSRTCPSSPVVAVERLPSGRTEAENRIASFVSPRRVANQPLPPSPLAGPNVRDIRSSGRSFRHGTTLSQPTGTSTELNRQALLRHYQRVNEVNCQRFRTAATTQTLTASTPIAGDQRSPNNDNFIGSQEFISPIVDDNQTYTPTRVSSPSLGIRRDGVNHTSRTHSDAPRIHTPIPATQDVPDSVMRRSQESSPPRELRVLIVPETPSPVRKSPCRPSTPFRALSSNYAATTPPQNVSVRRKTILKPRSAKLNVSNLSRLRVSFNENVMVHEIYSDSSDDDSNYTSDGSIDDGKRAHRVEEERSKSGSLSKKKQDITTNNRKRSGSITNAGPRVHRSRRTFTRSRTHVFDEEEEPISTSPPQREQGHKRPPKANSKPMIDRTDGNVRNMILDDFSDQDDNGEEEGRSNSPPPQVDRTNTTPVAIESIETPRRVLMEIIEPPSAFCDDGSQLVPKCEEPMENEDAVNQCSPPDNRNDLHNSLHTAEGQEDDGRILKNTTKSTQTLLGEQSRIVSVSSPNDIVPLRMTNAVDEIHYRAGDERPVGTGDQNNALDRRTTIVLPTKRRTTKSRVDPDAESYFKLIEKTCSQERRSDSIRKERRKLFAREIAEGSNNYDATENIPSPVPLPTTQETVPVREKNVPQLMTATVVVELMTPACVAKLSKCPSSANDEMEAESEKNDQDNGSDDHVREKHVEELSEKSIQFRHGSMDPPTKKRESKPKKAKDAGNANRRLEVQSVRSGEDDDSDDNAREKQRKEASEKSVQTKHSKKQQRENTDSEPIVKPSSPRKRGRPKLQKPIMYAWERKHLKDVSNEIRHQVESEGPRRSNRNRRIAPQVLYYNPSIKATDVPNYKMPSSTDVVNYYKMFELPKIEAKAKAKARSDRARKREDKRERKRREQQFDADGFRIPPPPPQDDKKSDKKSSGSKTKHQSSSRKVETDSSSRNDKPGPSSRGDQSPSRQAETDLSPRNEELDPSLRDNRPGPSKAKKNQHPVQDEPVAASSDRHKAAVAPPDSNSNTKRLEKTNIERPNGIIVSSGPSGSINLHTTDSGLSSAAVTNDDVTEQPMPSTSKKTESSGKTAVPTPEDNKATVRWMHALMADILERPEALPTVDIEGFAHLSVEHLSFKRIEKIEYSFYIYSNGDNFGFIRFLPNAKKKVTRTKNCQLKLLVLNGTINVCINEYDIKATGGDFLMLPADCTYKMYNGTQPTLIFMIKTVVPPKT